MLVLFETPAGYSLFKVNDESKLRKTSSEEMYDKFFVDKKKTSKLLKMVSFQPFQNTADAVSAATACIEGKVSKSLSSFLKKKTKKLGATELALEDKAMASSLKETLPQGVSIVHDSKTQELFRGIREHMEHLLVSSRDDTEDGDGQLSSKDLRSMQLGLSHSLSRYKLKFSADKVDTMIIQAIGLLDELDKEINTYAMRVKEWYGWHFPELQALVGDNIQYAKCVVQCGIRSNYRSTDLSSIFEDEGQVAHIQETAELSMGTEIAEVDILHIQQLADQVLSMTEYRSQLFEYLKNRMNAIAPNLSILVGDLVGARLIAHSGSLLNLAKQPASTIQILGAEKALFRALKTKHDTPKYGLIYHASLVGQASTKNKGKISRVLAAKAALAIRVDALSDETTAPTEDHRAVDDAGVDTTIGFEGRAKVEARLRQLEGGGASSLYNPSGLLTASKTAKYDPVAAKISSGGQGSKYNDASDMVIDTTTPVKQEQAEPKTPKEKKKVKKEKSTEKKKKKKDKKRKLEQDDSDEPEPSSKKHKADSSSSDEDAAQKKAAKKAKKEAKKAKKEKRKSKE